MAVWSVGYAWEVFDMVLLGMLAREGMVSLEGLAVGVGDALLQQLGFASAVC